jgi:hypothetical protein
MANSLIAAEIDPEGRFGADPNLGAAATYRALEIVCSSSSARELSRQRGESRIAQSWLQLAEQYNRQASRLIQEFRPKLSGPKSPVHS